MKFIIICLVGGLCIGFFSDSINTMFSDKSIKNPTYDEMLEFLEIDQTDKIEYTSTYVCENYANDILKNAKNCNIRAGFVYIEPTFGYGHAIVVFETTDKGLYFLEPQFDVVWSKEKMNEMKSTGYYHVTAPDGEYFYFGMEYYSITEWNSDVI